MARSFNGSSDYIACGTSPGLTVNSTFTLSIWAMATLSQKRSMFSTFEDTTNFEGIGFYWGGGLSGNDHLFFLLGSTGTRALKYDNAVLSLNTWYQFVLTYDGSSTIAGMKLFKNGAICTTTDNAVNPGAFPDFQFNIGVDSVLTSTDYFQGRLAEAAIWSVVLTAGEISALGGGARPRNIRSASLLRWWPLDGLQSPEPDLSGNRKNGTLTGTSAAPGPPTAMFTSRQPRYQQVISAAQTPFLFTPAIIP